MVSPKGFSVNVNVTENKRAWVIALIRYLMLPENQRESAEDLYTMPTHLEIQRSEFVQQNEILRNSRAAIDHGHPMPVVPQLRAIWDAMRPSYQAVLAGTTTAERAAREMQQRALQRIKEMDE